MRIAIFGAGSVGGYFGGRLAQVGEDVIFIARGEHLKAMRTHGLRVDSINGDFAVQPVQATDDPSKTGVVDLVLVGVKAWQVSEAAEAMRPMIGPETFVLPLQNGIEAPAQLSEVLGDPHVLGGLCGLFCYVDEVSADCSVERDGGGYAYSDWDMAQPARDSPDGGTGPPGNDCRSGGSRYFIAGRSLADNNDHV